MESKVIEVLDQEIDRPPKSLLEPHTALIRELRQRRRTYRQIAAFLASNLDVHVHWTTVHAFVKVRSRGLRRPRYELPSESEATRTAPNATAARASGASSTSSLAESAYAAIERFKNRPRAVPPPPPRFHFEEGEVLTLSDKAESREKKD